MIKGMRDRGLALPALLVFAYMFMPMIISIEGPAEITASGSSAGERGVGGGASGPLDITGVSALDMNLGTGFFNTSRYRQGIERPNYLNYAHASLPVDNPLISSHFGWRVKPCGLCSSDHKGVDFVPGAGKPVKSVLNGVVVNVGVNSSYGYWVKVEHIVPITEDKTERWESVYAHLQSNSIPEDVLVGANVSRGQVIGAVGNTGISTGPHLHFELRIDGVAVDPLPIISQSQVLKESEVTWK